MGESHKEMSWTCFNQNGKSKKSICINENVSMIGKTGMCVTVKPLRKGEVTVDVVSLCTNIIYFRTKTIVKYLNYNKIFDQINSF